MTGTGCIGADSEEKGRPMVVQDGSGPPGVERSLLQTIRTFSFSNAPFSAAPREFCYVTIAAPPHPHLE